MAIVLDESLILGIAGLVFVPVFVFCIKMIMKVGTLEQKIDALCNNVSGLIGEKKDVERVKSRLNLLDYQVGEIIKDLDYIMRKADDGAGLTRTRERERREVDYRGYAKKRQELDREFDEKEDDEQQQTTR